MSASRATCWNCELALEHSRHRGGSRCRPGAARAGIRSLKPVPVSWLRPELQNDELSQAAVRRGLAEQECWRDSNDKRCATRGAQNLAAIGGPVAVGAAVCAAAAVQGSCELVQAGGVRRAGPFNQAQQLVGFATVKDPGNDDGPASGFIRVEDSPVPHSETPRVLHDPFQALDPPGLSSCIAIDRLVYAHPDRRIESLQVLDRTAGIRNGPLQRPSSRFSSSSPHKRPASMSSYASPRRRWPASLRPSSSSGASNKCRTNGSPRSAKYSR